MNHKLLAIYFTISLSLAVGAFLFFRSGQTRRTNALVSTSMAEVLPPSLPQPVTDRVLASGLPSIRLTPSPSTKPLSVTSTKFAGAPYWPKAKEYPTDEKGRALMMLAQLNFAELPALERYPSKGILQFFISPHDGVYGINFDEGWDPRSFRVVYHSTPETNPQALARIESVITRKMMVPIAREHAVAAEAVVELASANDYRFDLIVAGAGLSEPLSDELYDQLYGALTGDGAKVGGYATFAQEDPRAHPSISDADGRGSKGEWLLLFQMDTHGDDIMWGDAGVANWFIRDADLANLDFSHVWYNWDCF